MKILTFLKEAMLPRITNMTNATCEREMREEFDAALVEDLKKFSSDLEVREISDDADKFADLKQKFNEERKEELETLAYSLWELNKNDDALANWSMAEDLMVEKATGA